MEMNSISVNKFNIKTKISTLEGYSLPTIESLKIIKNLPFDYDKLSSYYTEANLINFENLNIEDINIVSAFVKMLGYSEYEENRLLKLELNDYNTFLTDDLAKEVAISIHHLKLYDSFLSFLNNFSFKDNGNFLNKFKNGLFSLNQILILIAPSNILWVKSEKTSIEGVGFDLSLNSFNNIYFNHDFIKNKLKKLYEHPRCELGFLSSMVDKNLMLCVRGIETRHKLFTKISIDDIIKDYIISQKEHDTINDTQTNSKDGKSKTSTKPIFKRSMQKIISKFHKYNETNIVILESETDKIYESNDGLNSTKYNSLELNIFDCDHFKKSSEQKIKLDKEIDQNIDYLLKLMDNCNEDIRDYINKNPRSIQSI